MGMKNIVIERIEQTPVEKREAEMVERKGLGHPDSVADGIAEAISRELCREYLKRYGVILHHNTDQVEVVGGEAEPRFGGGEVLRPVLIFISGRATYKVGNDIIPIHDIAINAAKEYLRRNFRNLDAEHHVEYISRIGQGSVDLRRVFEEKEKEYPRANDTSFGVGFAPFTDTERIVLETEKYILTELYKEYKEIGEDVKVMGVRNKDIIHVTIAQAFVSKYVPDPDHYINIKEEIREKIADRLSKLTDREVRVYINTADDPARDIYYITVTGLSMEAGDDGSVGRGNRVNGLITPYRPMSMEAAAGKNPVNHVGKLYNILSFKIAERIYESLGGDVEEVYVRIVSQIGRPINDPLTANVQLLMSKNREIPSNYIEEIRGIVEDMLDNINKLTTDLINGKVRVF